MQTAKLSRESKRHERFTKKLLKREMRKHEKTARQATEEAEFESALKELEPKRHEWEEWHRLATLVARRETKIADKKPASAITILTQTEEQLPTEELMAPAPIVAIMVPDGRLEEPTAEISVAPAPESKPDQSLIPQQPVIPQIGRSEKLLTNTEVVTLSSVKIVTLLLKQKEEIYSLKETQQEEKKTMVMQHEKEMTEAGNDEARLALATHHKQEIAKLKTQQFIRLNSLYGCHGKKRERSGIDIKAFENLMAATIEASDDAAWPAIKRHLAVKDGKREATEKKIIADEKKTETMETRHKRELAEIENLYKENMTEKELKEVRDKLVKLAYKHRQEKIACLERRLAERQPIEEQLPIPTKELIAPAPVVAITMSDKSLTTAEISVTSATEPEPIQSFIPPQPAISQTSRRRKKKELTEEEKKLAEKKTAETKKLEKPELKQERLLEKEAENQGKETIVPLASEQEARIAAIKKLLAEQKQKLGEEQTRRDKEITTMFKGQTEELVSAKSTAELTAMMERHQNEQQSLNKKLGARINRLRVYHHYYREKLKKETGIELWQKATSGPKRLYNYQEDAISCYLHRKELLNYQASADKIARFLKEKEKAAEPKNKQAHDYELSEFLRQNIVSLVKKEETRKALVSAIKRQVKNIGQPTSPEPPISIADTNILLGRIWDKVESTGELLWLKKFCLTKDNLAKLILVSSNGRDLVMQGKFPGQDEWDEERLSVCLEKMDELIELGINLFVLREENKRRRKPNRQKHLT